MDHVAAVSIQHAAQIVERATDIDVSDIDMPVFVRFLGLVEAFSLPGRGFRPLRNVSMTLRHFSSEFSEQSETRSWAVDMWATAKRRTCPHTHSPYDDYPSRPSLVRGGLIQTTSGN
jgi:hypothetical protein